MFSYFFLVFFICLIALFSPAPLSVCLSVCLPVYIFVSFPPSIAAALVSTAFASSSLEAIFLMLCHLVSSASRFENCQRLFFFSLPSCVRLMRERQQKKSCLIRLLPQYISTPRCTADWHWRRSGWRQGRRSGRKERRCPRPDKPAARMAGCPRCSAALFC